MGLREQMAIDACAHLDPNELAERATWTPYGNTYGMPRTVRLIEQQDLQTVRRAHIWTIRDGTSTTQGDLFRIKRGTVTTTWRVMYSDPAETAMQRSYCHLQLTDTLTAVRGWRIRKNSGATSALPQEVATAYKCHWFQSSAEPTVENRKRTLQGEWYCLLETVPDMTTDITLFDSSDYAVIVDMLERPFNRKELSYLVCTRSDV
jgi:hypothetical protein